VFEVVVLILLNLNVVMATVNLLKTVRVVLLTVANVHV
jgi:hypothetical protein